MQDPRSSSASARSSIAGATGTLQKNLNFLSNPEQFSTAALHHTWRVGCAPIDPLATLIQ
jgi:hypothetical protein